MDKHKPSDEMIKDLDNLLSKLNAMEIVASDDTSKKFSQSYESTSRRSNAFNQ